MEVVDREKLEAVAVMRPSSPPREGRDFDTGRNGHKEFDLTEWIDRYNVLVRREGSWEQGGYRWVLEECPWYGHIDNAAYIVRFGSGAIAAGCHHNSCQGYGWRDFRAHYEPGSYERNGRQAGSSAAGPWADEWEDPEPLPEGLPEVATFDSAMLPGPLRGWISDISERMQVPPDYCAAGAIVVAASLIGRKVGIHPKRHDDWLVVPNLWGAVVGKPAMLKSPALAEIMKPLDRLVAEAREVHEAAKADHEAEVATHEALKAALKEEVKKAARESAKAGDSSKVDEAIARQRNLLAPQGPRLRRYKTEDATVEKLSELLMENPRGILLHRDELSGWLRSLDKQGREGDRSFYLKSWNGTGSFEVDRIGRGSLHVPALCLSILGGIQPGPLSSYVYEAARGGRGDDGLLQRFQLLVWPDQPKSWRNVDRWPDAAAKNRAYAVYEALDTLVPEDFGATASEDAGGGIPAVRFASEAQEVFDRWRDELETRLRSGDLRPALESHLAKYRSLMPSLALVFHLVASAGGEAKIGEVGVEATRQAAAWCEYLETHANRLYASAESPAMEGARTLLGRIRKGDVKDGSSIRDVYRGRHWSKLTTSEEVSAAAAVLEEYGWLRVEKVETGGRPATLIRLHPSIREAV
jgi:hypothetical protein